MERREIKTIRLPRWPSWARQTAWTFVLFALMVGGCNFALTGWPVPIYRIERLDKPASVKGWSTQGLQLADGRSVMPKGMTSLPAESKTIEVAVRKGVEVAPDGRIYGLLEYWHWCGNDPVRYDLRRVDLAQLLAFQREGKSELEPGWFADGPFKEGRHGWPHYSKFEMAFDPRMKNHFESPKESEEALPTASDSNK